MVRMNTKALVAAATKTEGEGLPVVAYYRMSSDEQQLSIDQQRKTVRDYCERRGYRIVCEYVDSGKSGSKDIAARTGFLRMVADSASAEWSAIICYNTSRFGRLNGNASAQFKQKLTENGVYLETVNEGRIDWSTSMGRLQSFILDEQNNKYALDLSADTLRGRQSIFDSGYWPVGEVPFGYDRQYVEGAAVQMTLPRSKAFRKPRNWHLKLVVNDTEAAVVRSIFKRFADASVSLRGLCGELNKLGELSPDGNGWRKQSLSTVLRNKAYVGICRLGFGRKTKEAHNRIAQAERADACPTILSPAEFDAVQRKLGDRAKRKQNSQQRRAGALSGILICGHCGKRLVKRDTTGHVRYVCGTALSKPGGSCKQWTVRETDLIPILVSELLDSVDTAVVARFEAKPPADAERELRTLRASVESLGREYEKARKNLRQADPELFADLQADALTVKGELDRARNTLAVAESATVRGEFERLADWWKSVRPTLVNVGATADETAAAHRVVGSFSGGKSDRRTKPILIAPEALRGLLETLRTSLTLHWTPRGKRYFSLSHGVLRAEVEGETHENVLGDLNATGGQNILRQSIKVERHIRFAFTNRDSEGRYRGRNPERLVG